MSIFTAAIIHPSSNKAINRSDNAKHLTDDHDEAHKERKRSMSTEKAMDFLEQKPKDWVDRFGRHFYATKHSHLDQPGEAREILPWLKLSAELNPNRIETYTVAAYWLRLRLGKVNEAEQFLRQGLAGRIPRVTKFFLSWANLYYENRHDPNVALNLWELALRRWTEQDDAGAGSGLGHLHGDRGEPGRILKKTSGEFPRGGFVFGNGSGSDASAGGYSETD